MLLNGCLEFPRSGVLPRTIDDPVGARPGESRRFFPDANSAHFALHRNLNYSGPQRARSNQPVRVLRARLRLWMRAAFGHHLFDFLDGARQPLG